MRYQWGFSTGSAVPSSSLRAYAVRLRTVLDTVSARIAEQYGAPLEWHGEDMNVDQWRDIDQIEEELTRQITRDDAGRLWEELGTRGVVLGRLPGATEHMMGVHWHAGSRESSTVPSRFGVWATVYTKKPELGDGRLFVEHPLDWLILLLCDVARSAQATTANLNYDPVTDAIVEFFMEQDSNADSPEADALTLVPDGIDPALLPPSLTAYPCPIGYPNGTVVAVDLQQATDNPESLVPDLISLGKLLKAQQGGSS